MAAIYLSRRSYEPLHGRGRRCIATTPPAPRYYTQAVIICNVVSALLLSVCSPRTFSNTPLQQPTPHGRGSGNYPIPSHVHVYFGIDTYYLPVVEGDRLPLMYVTLNSAHASFLSSSLASSRAPTWCGSAGFRPLFTREHLPRRIGRMVFYISP